jgi:ribosome-associated protein
LQKARLTAKAAKSAKVDFKKVAFLAAFAVSQIIFAKNEKKEKRRRGGNGFLTWAGKTELIRREMRLATKICSMNPHLLKSEITYRTARSGGKGGQNVNKVETKVEARFDVAASEAFSEEEKNLILEKLAGKISAEGILAATNQTARSQLANKQLAEAKLLRLVEKALHRQKKRKVTRTPACVKIARAQSKKRQSEKKASRQKSWSGE